MTIGLVTQPNECSRQNFLKRLLSKTKRTKEQGKNPFELVTEVLPFAVPKLKSMSSQKLERIIIKKVNRLKKRGADEIVYSDFLESLIKEKSVSLCSAHTKNLFFLQNVPDCIRITAKKCGIDLFNATVCISEVNAGRISEYLMRELCFDTKKIVLCTKNKKSAYEICEKFYAETGLLVKVLEYGEKTAEVCVDADLNEVKFATGLYVRDAELGFDFAGYNVSHLRIAGLLPEFFPQKIEWIYSHKKIS